MPHNVTAIPPTEEITGAATLPLARVKKILAVDDEINAVSANASFAITIATEMFIRYFAEQAMNVLKSERKPRRQIQYNDLANAVSRVDNLSFLEDIVPKTTTVREFRSRKARATTQDKAMSLQNGQTTLDGSSRPIAQQPSSQTEQTPIPPEVIDVEQAGLVYAQQQQQPPTPSLTNGQQLRFEHYEPAGTAQRDESGDIEMG